MIVPDGLRRSIRRRRRGHVEEVVAGSSAAFYAKFVEYLTGYMRKAVTIARRKFEGIAVKAMKRELDRV